MELAELTTLRLGGPADRIVEARTEEQLVAAVRERPALLVAGGSNLVVADASCFTTNSEKNPTLTAMALAARAASRLAADLKSGC